MKKIGILIIMTILLTNIALAAENTNTANNPVSLTEIETKQLFIQENAKTIAAIKQYIDKKTLEYEIYTKKEIESNFIVLDKRISKFTRDAGIKLGAIFFSGIIFGGLILIYINRQLKKKTIVKRELLDQRMNERITILEDDLKRIRIRAQQEMEERTARNEKKSQKTTKQTKKEEKKETPLQPPIPPKEQEEIITAAETAANNNITQREQELLKRIEALEQQNKDPREEEAEKQRKAKELETSIKAQYEELQKLKGTKKKERRGLFGKKKKDKTKWSDA